jgi:hypothetical protein
MRGLERALADLARSVRGGDGPKSETAARGESGGGDENARPTADATAHDDGLLVLSQPASRRHAPWFPEVNSRTATASLRKTAASSDPPAPAAISESAPGAESNAPRRRSILADAALEADAAAAAARSIRESREKEKAVSGKKEAAARPASARDGGESDRGDDAADFSNSAASAFALAELDESARRFARASRADSLEKLRLSQRQQSGDRPDWEIRLELIEAENERTRLRLERARLGRGAGETAALEEPKPRDASPPQPWR